jgi:hypothetical protein
MFVVYTEKNNQVSASYFHSENECMNYVENSSASHFQILPVSKQFNNFYISCLRWDEQKNNFYFDLDILIELKKDTFRFIRNDYFDFLDRFLLRAIEMNDMEKKNTIIDLKQKLRDVTAVNFPSTYEEIESFKPEVFSTIENLNL